MYSVWPIVKVEQLIASLQSAERDLELYALANAVGAATIAQLKFTEGSGADAVLTGQQLEEECQRARQESDTTRQANLTTLKTAFFLHIYHENRNPGGVKSLLFLRECITMAQMLRLDREASYKKLPLEEQQTRRRILWLLFITERGVSMLHKLPVVLKPNISFPTDFADDETTIFPAFQKLVNLFWIFDQSHAFDILQENETDVFRIGGAEATNTNCLDALQARLQNISIVEDTTNDIQAADIAVTRQWMRAVLWKASRNHNLVKDGDDPVVYCSHPFQIAKDFLEVTARLPSSALEAHGLCAELKIFEIASSVTDAISSAAKTISWVSMNRPRELLNRLHQILSSTRGGYQNLVMMLRGKIARITSAAPVSTLHEPSARIEELEDDYEEFPVVNTIQSTSEEQRLYNDEAMALRRSQQLFSSASLGVPSAQQAGVAFNGDSLANIASSMQGQAQFTHHQWGNFQQDFDLVNGVGYGDGTYDQIKAFATDSFEGLDMSTFMNTYDLWDGSMQGLMGTVNLQEEIGNWQ